MSNPTTEDHTVRRSGDIGALASLGVSVIVFFMRMEEQAHASADAAMNRLPNHRSGGWDVCVW